VTLIPLRIVLSDELSMLPGRNDGNAEVWGAKIYEGEARAPCRSFPMSSLQDK